MARDEADCKRHGCRHSPMHWDKTDSKLWANSIGSRPTTASSDSCQFSQPWTPASSSTASLRPRTATNAQSVVEDAQASAEAARAAADAALAAAFALDVLPAGLPLETSNIPGGTRHDEIGYSRGTYTHVNPASIISLGPMLPTLTAAAVSDFLGSLTRSSAVFDQLYWTPRMPVVEKPVDTCSLNGEAYSGNRLGSRNRLQRVNIARFERCQQELMVGTGSARASKLAVNKIVSQSEDSGTVASESCASSSDRQLSRAPTWNRNIGCSSHTNEAGTGNSAEASHRRFHRVADVPCSNSEKSMLPRIQFGVSAPSIERVALLDNACRQNDADCRPHQRRGLLMRAASRLEGSRNSSMVLPPLPLDSVGRCRSAASLHQQQLSCSGGGNHWPRSQSLTSSSFLPRALSRGASSSRLSPHRDPAASRGRVQIDYVRTQL